MEAHTVRTSSSDTNVLVSALIKYGSVPWQVAEEAIQGAFLRPVGGERRNRLALRSGFHSTKVPFTDWIGKKGPDGRLYQRKHTVWCECEVDGDVEIVTDRNLRLQTLDNRGADRGLRLGSETDQPEGSGDSTETDQKGAEAALRCNSPA